VPDPARFQAHLLQAHAEGKAAIKAVRSDLPVGVSLAIFDDQAKGRNSLRDAKRDHYYGEWLRAARHDDFVGIQNYERSVWTAEGKLPPPAGARINMMGAEVYPPSLAGVARYAHAVTGVPVLGYIHWSLVDNFEWVFGYRVRFGLHGCDRKSFVRTAKPSARIYGDIARRNAL
jgi:beta-glucosidase